VLARAIKLRATIQRDARKVSFYRLQMAVGAGLLNDDERIRLGGRITHALLDGTISAQEATALTRQLFPKKR
jgi:hypothetical protein